MTLPDGNVVGAGINAHQFSLSDKAEAMLRLAREQGSKMKFICLHLLSAVAAALAASG